MARELKITYGVFEVSEAQGRQIDSKIRIDKSHPQVTVEFDFVISKTTEAAFSAEITAVEDAFRKPYQRLKIEQGAATLYDFDPTVGVGGNTGFNAQPQIIKQESVADTGRSRRYTVRIVIGLPANTTAEPTAGLRESSILVSFSPSRRRTVTISGIFTAVGANTGRAQYDAQIAAYTTSVLTALGGTYELAEEPRAEHDTQNKILTFTRIFDELIFNQSIAALDDPQIVRQNLRITRGRSAPGDTPDVKRLLTIGVSYDAWIDKTLTTALVNKWDTSIKPFILTQVKLISSTIAIIEERPDFDFDNNRISASMTILGKDGSDILERNITVEDEIIHGVVLVPAWTGNPASKFAYQGPSTVRRTITDTKKVFDIKYDNISKEVNINRLLDDAKVVPAPAILAFGLTNFMHISSRTNNKPLLVGTTDGQFKVTEITRVDTYEFFAPLGAIFEIFSGGRR